MLNISRKVGTGSALIQGITSYLMNVQVYIDLKKKKVIILAEARRIAALTLHPLKS